VLVNLPHRRVDISSFLDVVGCVVGRIRYCLKPRSRVLRVEPLTTELAGRGCRMLRIVISPYTTPDHRPFKHRTRLRACVRNNMTFIEDVAEQSRNIVRLPAMYNDFITKNAGAVGQVEGALRSLTYLIPGRPLQRWRIGE
jgi:hypothetical protein